MDTFGIPRHPFAGTAAMALLGAGWRPICNHKRPHWFPDHKVKAARANRAANRVSILDGLGQPGIQAAYAAIALQEMFP